MGEKCFIPIFLMISMTMFAVGGRLFCGSRSQLGPFSGTSSRGGTTAHLKYRQVGAFHPQSSKASGQSSPIPSLADWGTDNAARLAWNHGTQQEGRPWVGLEPEPLPCHALGPHFL